MGVLYDHYQAADREAATVRPDLGRTETPVLPGRPVFDGVHAKGIAPQVDLAELVGLIRGVPPTGDLVEVEEIYPPGEGAPQTDEEWEALPPDSPYLDGPGIFELPASVRDTLAEVDDERLPEPARQWAGADLAGVPILGGWCPPVPSSTSPARFSGT
ncbi:hypothetical protein ACFPOI_38730 [Nonomuraea angiospora]|uniref:Uncharacterized protein n=1 Tax=Nonomuraea angiospora TaxID=46172 RepID=A0ABR9M169_9ACTN|nr:hypothetical protein [Nonomuraea angiospora]MBE1586330.1 hypothetical protein [Nonomuraea angiospora]